jgi:hypothetical protein
VAYCRSASLGPVGGCVLAQPIRFGCCGWSSTNEYQLSKPRTSTTMHKATHKATNGVNAHLTNARRLRMKRANHSSLVISPRRTLRINHRSNHQRCCAVSLISRSFRTYHRPEA